MYHATQDKCKTTNKQQQQNQAQIPPNPQKTTFAKTIQQNKSHKQHTTKQQKKKQQPNKRNTNKQNMNTNNNAINK